jgi:hypothetical protein
MSPKIGSEKGVKEKLLEIKNALPDFKKTLVKPIDGSADSYEVKMKIGNGEPLFEEDAETKEQALTVNFSNSYFNGTIKDFQVYYMRLSAWLKEIFEKTHQFREGQEKTVWVLVGVEKGKDYRTSPTLIDLEVTWIVENPDISLTIATNPRGKQ